MNWKLVLDAELGDFCLEVRLESNSGCLALVGPNGSGKTTVLQMIAGAIEPASGDVEIAGETLFSSAKEVSLPMEGRGVGYVPQGFGLFPHLSVLENVAYGLREKPRSMSRAAAREAALDVLVSLDAEGLASRMPSVLSGGEKQRVALARALAVSPKALLLDEPLSALDVTARRAVREVLAAHVKDASLPTLLITHDVHDVAAFGAECCVLEAGRVVQQGRLEDLARNPVNRFVEDFVAAGRGLSIREYGSAVSDESG